MNVNLISNHTLEWGDRLFKWNGKHFREYATHEYDLSYYEVELKADPCLYNINDTHFIRLYVKENVGWRVWVHSDYVNKPDYADFPIMYDDGKIVFDNEHLIPKNVVREVHRIMFQLSDAGVFNIPKEDLHV